MLPPRRPFQVPRAPLMLAWTRGRPALHRTILTLRSVQPLARTKRALRTAPPPARNKTALHGVQLPTQINAAVHEAHIQTRNSETLHRMQLSARITAALHEAQAPNRTSGAQPRAQLPTRITAVPHQAQALILNKKALPGAQLPTRFVSTPHKAQALTGPTMPQQPGEQLPVRTILAILRPRGPVPPQGRTMLTPSRRHLPVPIRPLARQSCQAARRTSARRAMPPPARACAILRITLPPLQKASMPSKPLLLLVPPSRLRTIARRA
jgi:hypothetical protein